MLAGEALDLPGFGDSPLPANGDYSLGGRVAAVIALIDQQGRWPVHLVGNSLGGAISTRIAARRPGPGAHPDADLARAARPAAPAAADARSPLVSAPGVGRWILSRLEPVAARAAHRR